MKVRPSDIPGFPDDFEFRSPFPPATMLDGVAGDPHFQLALESMPARSWESASKLTRAAAGRVAVKWGVFSSQLASLKKMGELGSLPLGDAFVGLAEGRKLAGELLAFSDVIVDVVSRVPIVGPYARILVTFGKLLVQAFKRGQERKLTTTKNRPLGYAKDDDEFVVDDALRWLQREDWTRVFCPAWDGKAAFSVEDVSFVGDGTPDGAFIMPEGGWLPFVEVGLGCVPGVAGRFVGWQYIKKMPGSNRPSGPESLMSVASFEPSATQLSILAWQMVLKNSPHLFRVHAYEVKSRWHDFFSELLEWAAWLEDEGQSQPASMARAIATWIHRGEHTGGRWEVRDPWKKFKVKKVADATNNTVTENAGTLVNYIVDEQLARSQDAALGTLTCAYVEPRAGSFAAFKNPMLRDYCIEMRKLLLEKPEKACRVELDMVPDAEYRRELERVRKNCPTRTTPESAPKRTTPGWGDQEDVDPDPDPPPSDEDVEPSGPGLGGSGDDSGGGGAGLAIGLGVGLSLGAWGLSKLMRRR